jgi:DNA-binding GntR family transcriptional regulator
MQALQCQDADAAEQVMRGHLLAQLAALREMSLAAEAVDG